MTDSFGARSTFDVGGNQFEIYRLDAVSEGHVDRLPYSLKILLENLLRHEDGRDVTRVRFVPELPRIARRVAAATGANVRRSQGSGMALLGRRCDQRN